MICLYYSALSSSALVDWLQIHDAFPSNRNNRWVHFGAFVSSSPPGKSRDELSGQSALGEPNHNGNPAVRPQRSQSRRVLWPSWSGVSRYSVEPQLVHVKISGSGCIHGLPLMALAAFLRCLAASVFLVSDFRIVDMVL